MYCGTCLRDNSLASALLQMGHDVTLVPLYTPTLTDEPNVSPREKMLAPNRQIAWRAAVSVRSVINSSAISALVPSPRWHGRCR